MALFGNFQPIKNGAVMAFVEPFLLFSLFLQFPDNSYSGPPTAHNSYSSRYSMRLHTRVHSCGKRSLRTRVLECGELEYLDEMFIQGHAGTVPHVSYRCHRIPSMAFTVIASHKITCKKIVQKCVTLKEIKTKNSHNNKTKKRPQFLFSDLIRRV